MRIDIHEFSSRRVGIVTVHYENIAHLKWNGWTFDGDWEGMTNDKGPSKGAPSAGHVTLTRMGDVLTMGFQGIDGADTSYTGSITADNTVSGFVSYFYQGTNKLIVKGTSKTTLTRQSNLPKPQVQTGQPIRVQGGIEQSASGYAYNQTHAAGGRHEQKRACLGAA